VSEINGLRLAYRGLIAGLAGGYVWLAIALVLAIPSGDPIEPLRLLAAADPSQQVDSRPEALVFSLGAVQLVGGGLGIAFAYFVARYFTVRTTLATAAPCFALLAWLILRDRLGAITVEPSLALEVTLLAASILYGVVLGAWVPTRPEVTRQPPAGLAAG
jgi:hypothetical protein